MWEPLFEMPSDRKIILDYLSLISNRLTTSSVADNPDLLTGKTGESILWANFFLLVGDDQFRKKAVDSINIAFGQVARVPLTYAFCSGISGITWAYSHLIELGVCPPNLKDIISNNIDLLIEKGA